MKIQFHEHEKEFGKKIEFAKWFASVAHPGEPVEWMGGDLNVAGMPCATGASSEDGAWEVLACRWLNAVKSEGDWD